MDLEGLRSLLLGEEPAPVTITEFSSGFRGNGLANRLTNGDLLDLKKKAATKHLTNKAVSTDDTPDVENLDEHALKRVKIDALKAAVA